MMGYATDETEELMPLTCVLAHKLNEKMTECRRNGNLHWILPDTKTMVLPISVILLYWESIIKFINKPDTLY